jgi:hypothetical protein
MLWKRVSIRIRGTVASWLSRQTHCMMIRQNAAVGEDEADTSVALPELAYHLRDCLVGLVPSLQSNSSIWISIHAWSSCYPLRQKK